MAYTTITDPSAYFQTALYTGNGTSTNAITNDGNSDLQPDWLWLKARSIIADHIIFDSTRGTNKRLSTNTTGVKVHRHTILLLILMVSRLGIVMPM